MRPGPPIPDLPSPEALDIPDEEEDQPRGGPLWRIKNSGSEKEAEPLALPPLLFGAASLSAMYQDPSFVVMLRTVRLALRYGINAFDTSPWYHPSEAVLGRVLAYLEHKGEWKRNQGWLISKVGRFQGEPASGIFDYAPQTIKDSVEESLRLLGTDYLDVLYLHDVEFVATPCKLHQDPSRSNTSAGFLARDALTSPDLQHELGLGFLNTKGKTIKADEAQGDGDEKVIAAWKAMIALKESGKVRRIGISGYPLPVLLRLAHLLPLQTNQKPLDIILSYSHQTLQSTLLSSYAPLFTNHSSCQVTQLVNASPLSMGLLAPGKSREWHPARVASEKDPREGGLPIMQAIEQAGKEIEKQGYMNASDTDAGKLLARTALEFGLKYASEGPLQGVPTILGLSNLDEVHSGVRAWRAANRNFSTAQSEPRAEEESCRRAQCAMDVLEQAGVKDWAWASGATE